MAGETLQWQVVASLSEFGDFDNVSGGNPTTQHTDYTPGGERTPRKLPGTTSYGNITLTRVYVPARDKALVAWWKAYSNGLEQPRALTKRFLNAQKIPVNSMTYPAVRPESVELPDGQAGSSALAEIRITLAVEDFAL